MKTIEEKREYDRRWYQEHKEEIKARNKERYNSEYRKEWYKKNHDEQIEKSRARFRRYNTEEYRAKRRAKYAEMHKNDPMTDHRRRCIEAAKERTKYTLAERKERKMALEAERIAKADIKSYEQLEQESERKRETIIKYIDKWAHRKVFAATTDKTGEAMSAADVTAYYREACKYFRLQQQLDETAPTDYSTRNILSYKLRVIEEHFNDLLNKKYNTKSKIINAL